MADNTSTHDTLILVDVQPDFCAGGSLATSDGDTVATAIARYIARSKERYRFVVSTQDWHIDPGSHFSDTPDYMNSWPVHCVAHTRGAQLHPALKHTPIDEHFFKGHYTAAYSGFEAEDSSGVLLGDWLADRGITRVDVCGIATDYCVRATVLDAVKQGFEVDVLCPLCAAVAEETGASAFIEMERAGARLHRTAGLAEGTLNT